MDRVVVIQAGISISAFFMFALALAIPSGYSYGSLGLLLFALMDSQLADTADATHRQQTTHQSLCIVGSALESWV